MPRYSRLYRVFPWNVGAQPGESGHPLYVHPPQGAGRIDNPEHYLTLYVSDHPEGAIGEAFGNHRIWTSDLIAGPPFLENSVRALATFEASDVEALDLDDPEVLAERRLRPSRVVTRDRSETQRWALHIFREQRWDGVRWWSYHDPEWGSFGLWRRDDLTLVEVSPLTDRSELVQQVALRMGKVWE